MRTAQMSPLPARGWPTTRAHATVPERQNSVNCRLTLFMGVVPLSGPPCEPLALSASCTSLTVMKATPHRRTLARAWLPYSLAGILWVTVGAVVLGNPQGLGLVFIGLTCLSFGLYGARWRLLHGHGLLRNLPKGSR